MKKSLCMIIAAILLLSGCAAAERDCLYVTDEIAASAEKPYSISTCLPEGMIEAVSCVQDESRLYEAADGSFYVVTQILSGCTASDAIRQMTGSDAKTLGALCTRKGTMPEYRFSWCMEGERGLLSCTGIVLADADTCYCLQFCADEACAKDCAHAREQVLSGFGLYREEGF